MMDQAYHLKAKGTEYFSMGLWEEAAERYHEGTQILEHPRFNVREELPTGWALEAQKLLISLKLNEAQCELKREEWNSAIRLCTFCIEQPSLLTVTQQVKAHYRRHQAHFARQEHDEALADLHECSKLDANNKDVVNVRLSTDLLPPPPSRSHPRLPTSHTGAFARKTRTATD